MMKQAKGLLPSLRISLDALPLLLFIPLFGLAVLFLFNDYVTQFQDESESLLGGYLIVRGYRLYVDYFSNHMPAVHYLSAVPALLGASKLEHFRLFSNALLVVASLGVVWGFRHRIQPPVLYAWAVTAVLGHVLFWGHMILQGNIAAFALLVVALLFFTTPGLQFTLREKIIVSAGIFVAMQAYQLSFFLVVLLGVCYLGVRLASARRTSLAAEARDAVVMLGIVAAPHVALLLAFLWAGMLEKFIEYAYWFNRLYYSQFVMNPSLLGMLRDWQSQYRTFLYLNLMQPFGPEWFLIAANFLATWIVFKTRGLVWALLFYLVIALTRMRTDGPYYIFSFFSVALCIHWAAASLMRWIRERRPGPFEPFRSRLLGFARVVVPSLFLIVAAFFYVQLALLHDFSDRPVYPSPYVPIVQAATSEGEQIWVAPFDPYLYLASERMLATKYPFYFPWLAASSEREQEILQQLRSSRPALVVFKREELVNDLYPTLEWGKRVYDYLRQDYVQIDESSPLLGNVFMRPDRVEDARRALEQAGPYEGGDAYHSDNLRG